MMTLTHIILSAALVLQPAPDAAHASRPAIATEDAPNTFPSASGSLIVPGVARPSRMATLAAPVEGALMHLHVRPADTLRRGDLIAQMDDTVARAAERAAAAAAERTAAVDRARANLELSRSRYERLSDAADFGGANAAELDEARAQFRAAEAELALAIENQREARLAHDLALARLEQHLVRAPFDATVVRIIAREGETYQVGAPIAMIADLRELRIDIDLPAAWLSDLRQGASYLFRAEAPLDSIIPARLTHVEPILDPATASARCTFVIDNADRHLPAGFAVMPATSDDTPQPPGEPPRWLSQFWSTDPE